MGGGAGSRPHGAGGRDAVVARRDLWRRGRRPRSGALVVRHQGRGGPFGGDEGPDAQLVRRPLPVGRAVEQCDTHSVAGRRLCAPGAPGAGGCRRRRRHHDGVLGVARRRRRFTGHRLHGAVEVRRAGLRHLPRGVGNGPVAHDRGPVPRRRLHDPDPGLQHQRGRRRLRGDEDRGGIRSNAQRADADRRDALPHLQQHHDRVCGSDGPRRHADHDRRHGGRCRRRRRVPRRRRQRPLGRRRGRRVPRWTCRWAPTSSRSR